MTTTPSAAATQLPSPPPLRNLRDEWQTPLALFRALDDEFGFDLDAAANADNALCARWLGPGGLREDALGPGSWPGSRIWLNPPYSRRLLVPFLIRAHHEARDLDKIVMALVPVRTEMPWWHDQVLAAAASLRFLRCRVKFTPPPGYEPKRRHHPVNSNALVIYRPHSGSAPRVSSYVLPTAQQPLHLAREACA